MTIDKNKGLFLIGGVAIVLSIIVLVIIYGTSKVRGELLKNVKVNETLLTHMDKDISEKKMFISDSIDKINEDIARNQMRLNLKGIGTILQKDIENRKFVDNKDMVSYIRSRVNYLTYSQRMFNEEGDWFTLLTIGPYTYFINDNSSDCAQPIINGIPIIDDPNRVRTVFDEVIWQKEARLILSLYGLIELHPYQNIHPNIHIDIPKKFKIDDKLNNLEVIRYEDIVYIKTKYPEVFIKLRNMRIIMHDDTKSAEDVMKFIQFHKATSEEDRLFWQFNSAPRKEILEVYVVPPGILGLFGEHRMNYGGIYNENYVKISLVSGCQIYDVNKKYDKVKEMINNNIDDMQNINQIKSNITMNKKLINYLDYLSIFTVLIVICSIIFAVITYRHIPRKLIDDDYFEHMCNNHCQRNNKEVNKK